MSHPANHPDRHPLIGGPPESIIERIERRPLHDVKEAEQLLRPDTAVLRKPPQVGDEAVPRFDHPVAYRDGEESQGSVTDSGAIVRVERLRSAERKDSDSVANNGLGLALERTADLLA